MNLKSAGRAVLVSLGAAAMAVTMIASPAAADPTPATEYRTLAGTGSDTTQDVMNGLGSIITSGGNRVVASYDARSSNPAQIKTKASNCTLNRPNGSGNGRRALRAAQGEDLGGTNGGPGFYEGSNVAGCVDFARSSAYGGGSTPSATGTYTYIPFGVDAVGLGINQDGDLPFNMSFAQVQRVYKCFDTGVAGNPVRPRMIQAGSGTWDFWLTRMAITETEINLGDYPCLANDADNNPATPAAPLFPRVQEHDGTPLAGNPTHVVPFSAAQFIAQTNSATILAATGVTVADRRGPVRLTGLSTSGSAVQQPISAGVLNVNFPLRRDVYNVVATSRLTDAAIASTFVGAGSPVCTATANAGGTQRNVVQLFGFGLRTATVDPLNAACGSTTLRFNS